MDQQMPAQAIVQAAQTSPEAVLHWALGVIVSAITVVGGALVRTVLRHDSELKVTGALQTERHAENKEALMEIRDGQKEANACLAAIRKEQHDVLMALNREQRRRRESHDEEN